MKTETQEHEYNLALSWFEGKYDQDEAELSAELQGINFNNVIKQYGNIYNECEAISNGQVRIN